MAGNGLTIKPLGPLAAAITSLFQPPPSSINGVDTGSWFGPLQPVQPIAPAGTEPRGWQYAPGQNQNYTPRVFEEFGAVELRKASLYPLARVLIENVKDSVSPMPVNIRLRRHPGESGKDYAKRKPDQSILRDIGDIIDHPNPDQNREQFMRALLEDMLTIDAASVLFRTTKAKKLQELRTIDGALITRYIDEQGFTPQPPSPAYAQCWYGTPMVDLNTRQLLYASRNVLPYRLYGCSPLEQAFRWIQLGIERLTFKIANYTSGTIPDAMQVVPRGIKPDEVQEAQMWLDSDLAGNLAKRRQIRLIQGFADAGKEDQIIFPKEALMSDNYDDLEINYMCFAFGVSKQRLTKQMNRASAESDQSAADKEGTGPWLNWASGSVYNKIIQDYLGFLDYECVYEDATETDPLKQEQINDLKQKSGRYSINELRENDGADPRDEIEAEQLMVITATGPVPLSAEEDVKRTKAKADASTPEPDGDEDLDPVDTKKKARKYRRY